MSKGTVSERHPAHAVILERPAPRIPDVWLITGTSFWRTFPCSCRLGKACDTSGDFPCRCWGRITGLDEMPPHCCAGRAARLAAKASATVEIGASC